MASRLYRSTRGLYRTVERHLRGLGIVDVTTPTQAALIALYVTGVILLDARPTQTRVARFLPARCHDALNRLLRTAPLSTRALMRLLMAFARRQGRGYLSVDDVVIEKAYAKRLHWAAWTYSFAKKRKVYGLHIVLVLWSSHDGHWRIPVAFRLWRPKKSCAAADYRTKGQLAERMLLEILAEGLPFDFVVFDTHYTSGWLTKKLGRLGVRWVGVLPPRTTVFWHGRRLSARELCATPRLKWRQHLGLRATALRVWAPKYGHLRLVATRNRHGNYEALATNGLDDDLTTVVLRKRARWSVETIFRDTKQYASLEACQAWTDSSWVRHVALVLLAFVVLQRMRLSTAESVAAVKERCQLHVLRDGQSPLPPIRSCPAHLRATA